ncbi:Rid family hydrolase [Flammeovirga sp. EKP202]|uniref:Rid family hydrolase n=1 Tax=Flammeovirga sp. EKP202 TaxID=2770592 RepID=UPI00165F896E|nr:Rid family hydrolase [Flammeovirga sp. EKP202]MBD0400272.1 RidA family protein [Flammeovirga sp. EKP202]
MITRKRGTYIGRNKSSAYKDLVWTVATTKDTSLPLEAQIEETLQIIDDNLQELGSNKYQIVSAQVYLAKITDKPVMDKIWKSWIGDNPDHWPQRACLGVDLEGDVLIEVSVTAVAEV